MKNVSMAQRYAMKIALPDIMLVYQYIFLLFEIWKFSDESIIPNKKPIVQ